MKKHDSGRNAVCKVMIFKTLKKTVVEKYYEELPTS